MKKISSYLNRIKKIAGLGSGFFVRLKIICLYTYFTGLRILSFDTKLRKPRLLRMQFNNKIFNFYISRQLDFDLLYDTFVSGEYKQVSMIKVEEVSSLVDLGSNIGSTVIYFKTLYPDSRIIAVEPDPNNLRILKLNTQDLSGLTIYDRAVFSENETSINFFVSSRRHWSSSIYKKNIPQLNTIAVKTITLDKIIEEQNLDTVDILKFDIEGAEYEAFRNFKNLNKVRLLIGEIHTDLFNRSFEDFISLFPNFDVVRSEVNKDVVLLKNRLFN